MTDTEVHVDERGRTTIRLADGKYEIRHAGGNDLVAYRFGEPWRRMTGDKLVLAMANAIAEQADRIRELQQRGPRAVMLESTPSARSLAPFSERWRQTVEGICSAGPGPSVQIPRPPGDWQLQPTTVAEDCARHGCRMPGRQGQACGGACELADRHRIDAETDPTRLTARERTDRAIRAISPTRITLSPADWTELQADPRATPHLEVADTGRRYRGIDVQVEDRSASA